jgi:hypothetical protein
MQHAGYHGRRSVQLQYKGKLVMPSSLQVGR